MSKAVQTIIKLVEQHDIDMAYGLAPNPGGFTFISEGLAAPVKVKMSKLLDELDPSEEKELRKALFNHS